MPIYKVSCELEIFWWNRRQAVEEIAQSAIQTMSDLQSGLLIPDSWKGLHRELEIWSDVEYSQDYFMQRFIEGQNRYDIQPREIIKELGYSLSLLHAIDKKTWWSISFHCGCTSTAVFNSIRIRWRALSNKVVKSTAPVKWSDILNCVVQKWNPEHGEVRSFEQPFMQVKGPLSVGAYTYFGPEMQYLLPEVPAGIDVARFNNGNLLSIGVEELPFCSETTIKKLKKLQKSLKTCVK